MGAIGQAQPGCWAWIVGEGAQGQETRVDERGLLCSGRLQPQDDSGKQIFHLHYPNEEKVPRQEVTGPESNSGASPISLALGRWGLGTLGALAVVPWIHLPCLAPRILESRISKSQHHWHWASSFIVATVLHCILYPPHASGNPSP